MKLKIKKVSIGNMWIQFTSDTYRGELSDTYRGELLDTIVTINGIDIMTIASTDIDNVIKVLKSLNAYRI